jgi:hypothetical protein
MKWEELKFDPGEDISPPREISIYEKFQAFSSIRQRRSNIFED